MKPVQTFDMGKDSVFRSYDPDASPEMFGLFSSFVELWQTKRTGRRLPAWKDFSFDDLRPWIGKMALVDLDPGVYEGVYRLYGGNWVTVANIDLTKKRLSEDMPKVVYGRIKPYFESLFRDGLIGHRVTWSSWRHREFINVEILDLLLSDNGTDVTQSLSVLIILND